MITLSTEAAYRAYRVALALHDQRPGDGFLLRRLELAEARFELLVENPYTAQEIAYDLQEEIHA